MIEETAEIHLDKPNVLRLEARRTRLEAYTSPTESSPISANPVLELRYLFAEGLKVPIAWVRSIL